MLLVNNQINSHIFEFYTQFTDISRELWQFWRRNEQKWWWGVFLQCCEWKWNGHPSMQWRPRIYLLDVFFLSIYAPYFIILKDHSQDSVNPVDLAENINMSSNDIAKWGFIANLLFLVFKLYIFISYSESNWTNCTLDRPQPKWDIVWKEKKK